MIRAGTPAAIEFLGIEVVTTEPAAITQPLSIITPSNIIDPAPTQQLSFIFTPFLIEVVVMFAYFYLTLA